MHLQVVTSLRGGRSTLRRTIQLISKNCSSRSNTSAPAVFFFNDIYKVDLAKEHRFPMHKYQHVRETVQREYAKQPLLQLYPSPLISREELATTHSTEYVARYIEGKLTELELRRQGFPWSTSGAYLCLYCRYTLILGLNIILFPFLFDLKV
jgi:hypothetical protein